MQLVMHIFRKDARRFWWEVAVALGLLVWLARMDTWRADFMPSPMEGWLNLLLPFTWSYLIALVVLEDPLVGERQFWVSMPCRWPVLLWSKALFAIAFIHVPYLLASAMILWARGFEPWLYVPQLLWKQLEVFAILTLPAFALATVAKNIAQFMLAAVMLTAMAVFMDVREPWLRIDYVRNGFGVTAIATGAITVATLQYARRSTTRSRLIGTLAVVVAASIYMMLPREASASLQCAFTPAKTGRMELRVSQRPDSLPDSYRRMWARNGRLVTIPVDLSGAPDAPILTRYNQLSMELETSAGEVVQSRTPTPSTPFDIIPFHGLLYASDELGPRLVLTMSSALYERLKASPVIVRGRVAAGVSRLGSTSQIPVNGATTVRGLGHCSSSFVEARMWEEMLKVHCENPDLLPLFTHVQITSEGGRVWKNRLGDSSTWTPYPRNTWLSPLHRRQTFFSLVPPEESTQMGRMHLVPNNVPATASLTVTPESMEGCTIFPFELKNIDLNRYTAR